MTAFKEKFRTFLLLTLATLTITAGVYFFKFPNHFSTGGVSGLSIILAPLIPALSPGTLVMIFNLALLLIGLLVFGKNFGIKTAYCSVLTSFATWGLEKLFPMDKPFTNEPLLELIFAVMLPAVGSAVLFNIGASGGGTDIVAMILKKFTNIDIGKALLCSDVLITLGSLVMFGPTTGLYSILGLMVKSLLVDSVIESINLCKYFTIISANPQPICDFIVNKLHRSATICSGEGAFSHEDKKVILTVLKRSQAVELRNFIRITDPASFILITNTSEIIGKGFRGQN